MAAQAEQKLNTKTYHGETRCWDFEWYVTVHQEQHMILNGFVQHGYAGINEQSKTWYLMNGIKTQALHPIKTQILVDTNLCNDFAQCVVLFKDCIAQTKANKNPELNISALGTRKEKGKQKGASDGQVEDQYYTSKEYHALSPEQKKKLKEMGMKGDINHSRNPTKQHSIPGLNSFHANVQHSKLVTQLMKQITPREMATTMPMPTTMPMSTTIPIPVGITTTQPLPNNRTTSDDQYSMSVHLP